MQISKQRTSKVPHLSVLPASKVILESSRYYYITQRPLLILKFTIEGRTPLGIASEKGFAPIVKILLARRAETDPATDESPMPLYLAALHGHEKVVELLLEYGADKTRTWKGKTAWQIAKENDHKEVMQLLAPKIQKRGGHKESSVDDRST